MIPALLTMLCLAGDPAIASEPPEPATALSMSLVIGFGAGHYYAKRPGMGLLFTAVEGAAMGTIIAQRYRENPDSQTLTAAVVVGSFMRAVEILSAPMVAVNARQDDILPDVDYMEELRESRDLRVAPREVQAPQTVNSRGRARSLVSIVYAELDMAEDEGFEDAVEEAVSAMEAGFLPSHLRQLVVEYMQVQPDASVAEAFSASTAAE